MRGILETVAVAFSMFSALPMPQISWEKRNMRYALCAFPLVGGVIGGLCWLWGELCQWGGVPDLLRGAVLCLLPAAVTGGIHLTAIVTRWMPWPAMAHRRGGRKF